MPPSERAFEVPVCCRHQMSSSLFWTFRILRGQRDYLHLRDGILLAINRQLSTGLPTKFSSSDIAAPNLFLEQQLWEAEL